jgi:hypothetical protein
MNALVICTSCRSTIDPDADAVIFDQPDEPVLVGGEEVTPPMTLRAYHVEHAPTGWLDEPRADHGRMRDLVPRSARTG